jgi:hypothetical protein
MEVGVRALPILSLITFFIGLILALQAAYELSKLGAMTLVAKAVALSMSRELGPLITAIVVIGRSGSAFAAEIGTMKVSEEIDALEVMAINPVDFLVAPKFLAMIVMLPCLTIWANAMGILGGALFGVAQGGLYLGPLYSGLHRVALPAGYSFGIDQERDVWRYDYGGGLPGRIVHGRGRGASGPLDDEGRGDFDFACRVRRSRLYGDLFLSGRSLALLSLFMDQNIQI